MLIIIWLFDLLSKYLPQALLDYLFGVWQWNTENWKEMYGACQGLVFINPNRLKNAFTRTRTTCRRTLTEVFLMENRQVVTGLPSCAPEKSWWTCESFALVLKTCFSWFFLRATTRRSFRRSSTVGWGLGASAMPCLKSFVLKVSSFDKLAFKELDQILGLNRSARLNGDI